ncbi:peptide/nickel transport system ATP-binding protein [Monaibacterium marinum]|uniref:Peptide/nickel transport system ATP-binding protein n=1 Tax=Pontivivens marinum TaxID=1690039 RepID=A0A2C9CRN3_9RHOB|nr:ABC transporter ATP-binding protein [Monaibacterium marinum]SOH93892.1 peptide/nickel transport system ATP-binding protein [Monaibacterium marinum]
MSRTSDIPVLTVRDLTIALPSGADRDFAVTDIDLTIAPGQTLCLVGESGSGKSVVAQAVMGMLAPVLRVQSGEIALQGVSNPPQRSPEYNKLRGPQVAMVFQDAISSLNPIQRVGHQLEEILQVHGVPRQQCRGRVMEMLAAVMLPDPQRAYRSYPHEMSGGQAQRIVIAGALLLNPSLLIADEPTTALDVTTQAEILELIEKLKVQFNTSVLFITHDFGVVADIADQVVVMKDGQIVEAGSAPDVLQNPQHEYTKRLLAASDLQGNRPVQLHAEPIFEARDLSLTYTRGMFFNRTQVPAVRNVSLSLVKGQTLAVVGESGSGKSSLSKCLLRLQDVDSGQVLFKGQDITRRSGAELQAFRAKVQVVLQDPFGALDPRFKTIDAIAEGLIIHGVPKVEAHARALEMLQLVGLKPQAADRYPQEFSGGQRQRICIARALVLQPEVLIADEAVSALDVSIQVQVLELFADLQKRLGFSMVFITHDLHVAAAISDQVLVMQHGRVVEQGPTVEVFANPAEDYTRALLESAPGQKRGRVA